MKPLLEKEIQKLILDYLKAKKIFHWRNNTGAFKRDNHFYRFGDNGSPDIFLVIKGQIYGVEVKNEKGKQSEYQKEWQEEFEKAGGVYLLVRSLEELLENLSTN